MRRAGLILIAFVFLAANIALAQIRKGPLGAARRQPAPHTLLDRLNRMKPEQRQRALDRLPPDRRQKVEERLERYNRLSPEERERLRDEYDIFQQLRPEDRDAVRKMFRRFSRFPDDRRAAMRIELEELRQLNETERRTRIGRDDFRGKFSPPERRLLEELSGILPAPE